MDNQNNHSALPAQKMKKVRFDVPELTKKMTVADYDKQILRVEKQIRLRRAKQFDYLFANTDDEECEGAWLTGEIPRQENVPHLDRCVNKLKRLEAEKRHLMKKRDELIASNRKRKDKQKVYPLEPPIKNNTTPIRSHLFNNVQQKTSFWDRLFQCFK